MPHNLLADPVDADLGLSFSFPFPGVERGEGVGDVGGVGNGGGSGAAEGIDRTCCFELLLRGRAGRANGSDGARRLLLLLGAVFGGGVEGTGDEVVTGVEPALELPLLRCPGRIVTVPTIFSTAGAFLGRLFRL